MVTEKQKAPCDDMIRWEGSKAVGILLRRSCEGCLSDYCRPVLSPAIPESLNSHLALPPHSCSK